MLTLFRQRAHGRMDATMWRERRWAGADITVSIYTLRFTTLSYHRLARQRAASTRRTNGTPLAILDASLHKIIADWGISASILLDFMRFRAAIFD